MPSLACCSTMRSMPKASETCLAAFRRLLLLLLLRLCLSCAASTCLLTHGCCPGRLLLSHCLGNGGCSLHCLLLRQVWVPQPIQHRQHKVRPCSKAMTTSIDCAVLPTSRWLGDSMQP